jgi:hypothetical protein
MVTLEQLFKSLIRTILEYSSIVFPVISDASFNKLNIIQKKAIKIINTGWLLMFATLSKA